MRMMLWLNYSLSVSFVTQHLYSKRVWRFTNVLIIKRGACMTNWVICIQIIILTESLIVLSSFFLNSEHRSCCSPKSAGLLMGLKVPNTQAPRTGCLAQFLQTNNPPARKFVYVCLCLSSMLHGNISRAVPNISHQISSHQEFWYPAFRNSWENYQYI